MNAIIYSEIDDGRLAPLQEAANLLNLSLLGHDKRHSWVRVLGGSHARVCAVVLGLSPGDTTQWRNLEEVRRVSPGIAVFGWLENHDTDVVMLALKSGVTGVFTSDSDVSSLCRKLQDTKIDHVSAAEALCAHSARGKVLAMSIDALSKSDSDVLLSGPSGSGKEVCARLIHSLSSKSKSPFVVMNCAAIPHELLESELFGHAKGAYTGAASESKGLFREAEGGTLLIDEVSALPLAGQAKLLRVLQEREVRPVGSTSAVPINIRVIATTNKDLQALTKIGTFREDLFYRLAANHCDVPALEHRRADIPALAKRLLSQINDQGHSTISHLTRDALAALTGAHWPGNIRQLRAVICSVAALTEQPFIAETHLCDLLGDSYRQSNTEIFHILKSSQDFSLRYLQEIIKISNGNYRDAAILADIHLSSLYRLAPPSKSSRYD